MSTTSPTRADTPASRLVQEIMAPVLGVPAEEVDPASLGLGGLGIIQAMTLAKFADAFMEAILSFFPSLRRMAPALLAKRG